MTNVMRKKKWWKYVLPVIIVTKITVIVFLFESAKTDTQVIVEKERAFTSVEIPDSAMFAGEPLPLGRFDVREALDRELLSNAYFHSQTIRFIKLAPRYFSIVEPILKEKGIPEDFKYLAVAESNLDPRAVSPARAVGFWQFMSGTAQQYGLEVNSEIDERYHVEKATVAACNYLADSYLEFGNWTMVAASYNAGMSGVKRQMDSQKNENYYDLLLVPETQRYLYRIMALKLILENPEKYKFNISEEEKYPIIPTKEIEITGKIQNFADFAASHGISYKVLKDFNPWLRENYLTNSANNKYIIKIPVLN